MPRINSLITRPGWEGLIWIDLFKASFMAHEHEMHPEIYLNKVKNKFSPVSNIIAEMLRVFYVSSWHLSYLFHSLLMLYVLRYFFLLFPHTFRENYTSITNVCVIYFRVQIFLFDVLLLLFIIRNQGWLQEQAIRSTS